MSFWHSYNVANGVRELEDLRLVAGVWNGDAGRVVVGVLDLDGLVDELAWKRGTQTSRYLYLVCTSHCAVGKEGEVTSDGCFDGTALVQQFRRDQST